jgi:hypothetical protein
MLNWTLDVECWTVNVAPWAFSDEQSAANLEIID